MLRLLTPSLLSERAWVWAVAHSGLRSNWDKLHVYVVLESGIAGDGRD